MAGDASVRSGAVARMAGSYGVVYQPALRPPSTAITWPVT